jgi:hypothetical protein
VPGWQQDSNAAPWGLVAVGKYLMTSGCVDESPDSLAFFTQFPNVIACTPILRATSAIGRWSLMTKATACALYSSVNRRRVEPIAVSPEDPGGTYPVSTEPGTVQAAETHLLSIGGEGIILLLS